MPEPVVPPAPSAPLTPTTAPATAVDAAAVADVARILPGWLESVIPAHRLTGIQAAIWHDGALVIETAVGMADEPAGIPLRSTHRLRIASHSKMFCALGIMRLLEQGRLRLDDTLGEHVAELAGTPVADRTLRDLLSHAAGLTRDASDARWWQLSRAFPDRAELLEIARTGAAVTDPGVHLQYSNIGYGLLGLVIEDITGQPFADAIAELVIDPVGAGPLGPDLPADAAGPEDPEGFAAGHTGLLHGRRRVVEQIPTGALAPATGFWATAGGIATFAGRVLTADALLDPATLRTMRRRVWTLAEGRHYGLGLQEGTLHGFAAIGHSGGFPTGLTRTWALPAERVALSVLGTSIDSPTSGIALGVLGLLALASGSPAPAAGDHEAAGAQGGAGAGRPRPPALAAQPAARVGERDIPAAQLGELLEGTYDSLWGRSRLAVLGGRLFALEDTALDPSEGAVELRVAGTRPDPEDPSLTCVELMTWGDPGYGSWAEPMLARMQDAPAAGEDSGKAAGETGLRCTGLWDTGQMLVPTADLDLPDRVRAPR